MEIITRIGGYLTADLRMATPILLAALGLLIMNRSGLINIGVEGIMLMSTLTAVMGTYFSGDNVWVGMACAMATGAVMGLLFAFLTVTLRANQIVIGAAFNILGTGGSAMLYRIAFGTESQLINITGFREWNPAGLADIPLIGKAIFGQMPIVYLAFALVPIIHYFIFKTPAGLNLRAVGENPMAADTLGISVYRTRYLASIFGGILMAMGGAFLSTGLLRFFTEDMVAGRGYIALAAVIFGRYQPVGVMLATMLFALGNVIANALQAANSPIPYNLLVTIPYVLTIVVLAAFGGKSIGPAAAGTPYKKG